MPQPRRRQLEGQRQAIQPPADLQHGRPCVEGDSGSRRAILGAGRLLCIERRIAADRARPVDVQQVNAQHEPASNQDASMVGDADTRERTHVVSSGVADQTA